MSNKVPSIPSRTRTVKPVSNRGRLIAAILKIHNQGQQQRRRGLEAKVPASPPRIEPQGPRDGATGA